MQSLVTSITALALLNSQLSVVYAARQPYDVRKIIDAFRHPHDELTILCAHRGLRWNGTTENSRDSYFRATEAGLECIGTDIHLSRDDVGEQTWQPAYNLFTGKGYHNLPAKQPNFKSFTENLHLRDKQGRVQIETVPTLPDMVRSIHESGANVLLQLDFKDQLKNLTNRAGVPANEWCIYKLQAKWWKNLAEFEALDWVQDAFTSGVQIAYIPVYNPEDETSWDTLESLKEWAKTNYTVSAESEIYSTGAPLQNLQDYITHNAIKTVTFRTSGFFIPADTRKTSSAYTFKENIPPVLLDSIVGNKSLDGHNHRSDFAWIMKQIFLWVITDTADVWDAQLRAEGRRNISYMLAGKESFIGP
ncbi:hypothetical protein LY76DRAFT_612862 [Colletotrichum caudatum]|nr:hypothetical protein LY76DRAFT_612862 [Colletotrichum caudatum]